MSKQGDETLETAFQFIEQGNAFESSENWWSAAEAFGNAMQVLASLAAAMTVEKEGEDVAEEQVKISQLYQSQSREYLFRARECFVKALTLENDQDQQSQEATTLDKEEEEESATAQATEPLCRNISIEEAQRRLKIFTCLYSKKIATDETNEVKGQQETVTKKEEDLGQKQSSLEDRLMELNSSLPSGLKTSKERMAKINRGLYRLGVSLPTQEDHSTSMENAFPSSEQEQVQQIMAQAKDEAKFERREGNQQEDERDRLLSLDSAGLVDMEEELESEISDDSEDDLNSDLEESKPKLQNRKLIRKMVVEAQVKLAELVVLMDSKSEDEALDDDKNEAEETADFDFDYGKSALKQAKRCLEKALGEWSVCS